MNKLEYYFNVVSELGTISDEMHSSFPEPWIRKYGEEAFAFRHHPKDRSNYLASYLKLVKAISSLNACIHLMKAGFAQETHALARSIDDLGQDILFLANTEETGANLKDQIRMLNEFYKEISENPDEPLNVTEDFSLNRKKVRSATSNIMGRKGDPHYVRTVGTANHRLFSSFLHGSYVTIMELFNPGMNKFDMCGQPGTPRIQDCIDFFQNHIYGIILAGILVARFANRDDLRERLLKVRSDFAKTTGCVAE